MWCRRWAFGLLLAAPCLVAKAVPVAPPAVSRVVLDSLRQLLKLPQTDYDRVLLLC